LRCRAGVGSAPPSLPCFLPAHRCTPACTLSPSPLVSAILSWPGWVAAVRFVNHSSLVLNRACVTTPRPLHVSGRGAAGTFTRPHPAIMSVANTIPPPRGQPRHALYRHMPAFGGQESAACSKGCASYCYCRGTLERGISSQKRHGQAVPQGFLEKNTRSAVLAWACCQPLPRTAARGCSTSIASAARPVLAPLCPGSVVTCAVLSRGSLRVLASLLVSTRLS
jgi:hypothetical protein